jgi:hypothetical protein
MNSRETQYSAGRPPKPAWLKLVSFLVLLGAIAGCLWMISQESAWGGGKLLHYGLRVAMIALCLVGWFWTQAMIGSRTLKDGAITDGLHELFVPLHRWLLGRPKAANGVLIVSSAFIDLFGIFLILYSVFGPSVRPFVALLILFIFRQVCQGLCALPVPKDMIWRNPGFPSLLVTYGTSTDFFFSGHTAIAVLGAIELAKISPWLGLAGGIVAFLEAFVVIVLRAHYTMDVLGALAAVACAVGLADVVCRFL